jgi:hypothetical protein
MEDNLNILANRRGPNFKQMEGDLNILANGGRPQYCGKWKTTSIFKQMEDDINILVNGRQHR